MGLCYSEPDKIVFKSGDPIELNDRQSAETSKDESPATNGEDSVAKPLKEAEELPSVTLTSTSVIDPMKGIEFDHGMCSCGHALPALVVQFTSRILRGYGRRYSKAQTPT